MKTRRRILETLAMLLALCLVFVLVLRSGGTASGYPAGPTPTPSNPQGLVPRLYVPAVMRNYKAPPPTTISLYVTTVDTNTFQTLGQNLGTAGVTGLIILDFGNPRVLGAAYGTKLAGLVTTATTTLITSDTESFLAGWWYGYTHGGSTTNPNAQITVAVGVNNCGTGGISLDPNNPCVPGGTNMPPEHGRAWAQMIRAVSSWISISGYAAKETAAAAVDAEPGWNSNSITTQWVMSYTAYFTSSPYSILYDFGSCDGCSYANPDGTICTNCLTMTYSVTTTTGLQTWSWNLSDVRFVAWDSALDFPVPEIYTPNGTNARQWYGLSRYAYDSNNLPIQFQGTLTTSKRYGNAPDIGWEQLWGRIFDDPVTQVVDIPWSTDINFQ